MTVLGQIGDEFALVRGSRKRREAGQHRRDVQHFLQTGNTTVLPRWQGKRIGGVLLLTDPAVIEALYAAGRLQGGPYPETRP
jgi:hypothetical protein